MRFFQGGLRLALSGSFPAFRPSLRQPRCYMAATAMSEVLPCDSSSISFSPTGTPKITSEETSEVLQRASALLHDRQTVVFPTETVYGLGALALDAAAAAKIFSTKGRPADNPLIVHVSSAAMLQRLLPEGYAVPKTCDLLMKHFWPGPLTLLFPTNSSVVPSIITAGQPTVAVRMPSHPVARALIAVADAPIAAPSANSSGRPSPTRAEHVRADLGSKVSLILDGGPCEVGLESTVVDALHEDGNIRVLRPGGVTVEEIERVVQEEMAGSTSIPKVMVHRRDYQDAIIELTPSTPGMKYRHYSPTAPVILLSAGAPPSGESSVSITAFLEDLKIKRPSQEGGMKAGLLFPADSPLLRALRAVNGFDWHVYELGRLDDPATSAALLFDGLLTLDNTGSSVILAEAIREEKEGLAFMNRLRKAAGETVWIEI